MTQTHLHAEVSGNGTDMVLLHGWGLNGNVWQHIVPLINTDFRVHSLDLPGFGDSQWCPEFANISRVARRVELYIEKHCSGPAVLMGWSMGGLIATALTLSRPELIARVHTVASSPCFVAKEGWPGIQPQVLAQFQQQLDSDFAATLKRFLAVQSMGSPTAREDVKELRSRLLEKPQPEENALRAGLHWLAHVDYRDKLTELKRPLQRSYGRLDSLVPVKVNTCLNEMLGNTSDSVVFEKSAHTPFLNERDAFVALLKREPFP